MSSFGRAHLTVANVGGCEPGSEAPVPGGEAGDRTGSADNALVIAGMPSNVASGGTLEIGDALLGDVLVDLVVHPILLV
jgi:hypothetical protein